MWQESSSLSHRAAIFLFFIFLLFSKVHISPYMHLENERALNAGALKKGLRGIGGHREVIQTRVPCLLLAKTFTTAAFRSAAIISNGSKKKTERMGTVCGFSSTDSSSKLAFFTAAVGVIGECGGKLGGG